MFLANAMRKRNPNSNRMKNKHAKSTVLLTGCLLTGFAVASPAQITPTYQSNSSSADFYDSNIAVNLVQAGQSSLSSVTADASAINTIFSASGLNDGSAAGNGNKTYYEVAADAGTFMPNTATFQLTAGYNISIIQVITGWAGQNLGEQDFQVLLSIGGGAFTSYGTFANNTPFGSGASAQGSYLTTLNGSSGPIATDVTGVQFVFQNPDTSNGIGSVGASQAGSSGGTVIDELQVFGTISPVPEPATDALLGVGILGLALVYRGRLAC
jgi:hypothetical protein